MFGSIGKHVKKLFSFGKKKRKRRAAPQSGQLAVKQEAEPEDMPLAWQRLLFRYRQWTGASASGVSCSPPRPNMPMHLMHAGDTYVIPADTDLDKIKSLSQLQKHMKSP